MNRQRIILRNFTGKMILFNLPWIAAVEMMEFAYISIMCSPLAPFGIKWQILKEAAIHRAWHNELMRRFGKNEKRISMLMKMPNLPGAIMRRIRL
jgi:hypothetical protein